MSQEEFISSAHTLSAMIEELDQTQPLLREADQILRPILNEVISGRIQRCGQLPHRNFFYGMYEDSLPAHYLGDVKLMNAIADFDEAWRKLKP
jgi:hypothetical protein